MCVHLCCSQLQKMNACHSVAIAVLTRYYGKNNCILLGKECDGRYIGKYNMIGGTFDKCDKECWVNASIRETQEEAKITLTEDVVSESGFFMQNKTPVFCIFLNDILRKYLNFKIAIANSNTMLPWCEREMSDVQYINMNTLNQIDGEHTEEGVILYETPVEISSYALAVIKQIIAFNIVG